MTRHWVGIDPAEQAALDQVVLRCFQWNKTSVVSSPKGWQQVAGGISAAQTTGKVGWESHPGGVPEDRKTKSKPRFWHPFRGPGVFRVFRWFPDHRLPSASPPGCQSNAYSTQNSEEPQNWLKPGVHEKYAKSDLRPIVPPQCAWSCTNARR